MYSAIGNTPLIRLNSISNETGCEILAKAEFMNPGGSVKDRTALGIIQDAEQKGLLNPNDVIVEATTENFGVSLALLCNSLGYQCSIVIPENYNSSKVQLMEKFGASFVRVPDVPITDDNHYTKIPSRMVEQFSNVFWCNHHQNLVNKQIHYQTTAQELWNQTNGNIDAFVCSSRTGGTYSGVSSFLKEQNRKIKCVLADSYGSILYNWATIGEKMSQKSTSIEEIGNTTITSNINRAPIDDSVCVEDQDCINMIYHTLWKEGLFLGGVSGANIFAAKEVAKRLGPGHTIVTILYDEGQRYMNTYYDEGWLKSKKLEVPIKDSNIY